MPVTNQWATLSTSLKRDNNTPDHSETSQCEKVESIRDIDGQVSGSSAAAFNDQLVSMIESSMEMLHTWKLNYFESLSQKLIDERDKLGWYIFSNFVDVCPFSHNN